MKVTLPVLEPDKAYLGASLFLPKSQVAEPPVRRALTFVIGMEERVLVREHPHHLEVPRNYRDLRVLEKMGIEIVDLRPTGFVPIKLKPIDGFKLRAHQVPAWQAMVTGHYERRDMLLRLATGRGKTVMGWYYACLVGGPVLIVSAQEAHLKSWEQELRRLFVYEGEVGWIAGKKMEWHRDIVMTTVQTLVKRLEAGSLPKCFSRRFGLTIYDETHHQAAEWFSIGSDASLGRRLGLTATLKRQDRCEGIVTGHIGQVIYDDPEDDTLVPTIHIHPTHVHIGSDDERILDKNRQFNVSKMRVALAEIEMRNKVIVRTILDRLDQGHVYYGLSHIKNHVYDIADMLEEEGVEVGVITGDEKDSDERLKQLNGFPVVLATVSVGKENYNRPEFSAIGILTPMAVDHYAPTEWLQCVGRGLRPVPGKLDPVVDVFGDYGVGPALGFLISMIKWCRINQWEVHGDRTGRRHKTRLKSMRA